MKIKYILEGLDCANCAAKIEDAVKKIDGVKDASVSFMTLKMTVEVCEENIDTILENITKTVKKLEPDIQMKTV